MRSAIFTHQMMSFVTDSCVWSRQKHLLITHIYGSCDEISMECHFFKIKTAMNLTLRKWSEKKMALNELITAIINWKMTFPFISPWDLFSCILKLIMFIYFWHNQINYVFKLSVEWHHSVNDTILRCIQRLMQIIRNNCLYLSSKCIKMFRYRFDFFHHNFGLKMLAFVKQWKPIKVCT